MSVWVRDALVALGAVTFLLLALLSLAVAPSSNSRYDEALVTDFDTDVDQALRVAPPLLTTQITDAEVDSLFAEIRAAWADESR